MRCRVLERKLCFLQRVMGSEVEVRVREALSDDARWVRRGYSDSGVIPAVCTSTKARLGVTFMVPQDRLTHHHAQSLLQ